ncbi:hypothetical protein MMC13_006860 [Lambiella insularis]|nr:hypothetical protein [Lambiella insularis]
MAESQVLVASAVIVPDNAEQLVSPPLSSKRRPSSGSESGSKRLRLSQRHSSDPRGVIPSPLTTSTSSFSKEAKAQVEERRRGKRLFGALLGTLAQSSSSTAQKRRVDIEKKQQAKLRLQDEEHDEKKKQRLDAFLEVRQREQKKYNKQSYYMPWDLLPEDQAKIGAQIEDAEAMIGGETTAYEAKELLAVKDEPSQEWQTSPSRDHNGNSKTVGQVTNSKEHVDELEIPDANIQADGAGSTTENADEISNAHDTPREPVDDGGDIIIGEEDTVIY